MNNEPGSKNLAVSENDQAMMRVGPETGTNSIEANKLFDEAKIEKLVENIKPVEKNIPVVDQYIQYLLECKSYDEFQTQKGIIEKEPNFKNLLPIFFKNKSIDEVNQHFANLSIDKALNLITADETDNFLGEISGATAINSGLLVFLQKHENAEKALKHIEMINRTVQPEIKEMCRSIEQFSDFDLENCIKMKGQFSWTVISEKNDYVIKIVYKDLNNPDEYERNKIHCKKANEKNKKYFGKFLPKEDIFEDAKGVMFTKAEKIEDEKASVGNEETRNNLINFVDLKFMNPKNKEKIDKLMENPKFCSDLEEFIKAAEAFKNNEKGENNLGLLPDIAGSNLKIIYDKDNNYKELKYWDSTGYLSSHNKGKDGKNGSYEMAENVIGMLRSKILEKN